MMTPAKVHEWANKCNLDPTLVWDILEAGLDEPYLPVDLDELEQCVRYWIEICIDSVVDGDHILDNLQQFQTIVKGCDWLPFGEVVEYNNRMLHAIKEGTTNVH